MGLFPIEIDAFAAVAEPSRRRILVMLAEGGERAVNDLVARLGIAQSQVSKHLKVLRDSGLVSVRAAGRKRFYRVNGAALRPIHEWTERFEAFWEHQLDAVKETAERSARDDGNENTDAEKENSL